MHDYDPGWDYAVIELEEVDCLAPVDRDCIKQIIEKVRKGLAPAMGLENFEVFYTESGGIKDGQAHGIYCNGTSSRPIVGFDLELLQEVSDELGDNFVRQFEIALAHELAHAYQETLGLDHEHEHGFNEDDVEEFARKWADWQEINLHLIDPDAQKPGVAAMKP